MDFCSLLLSIYFVANNLTKILAIIFFLSIHSLFCLGRLEGRPWPVRGGGYPRISGHTRDEPN